MVDVTLIGGGVAGLWLLNRLKQQGYSVVLCERGAIGAGQTGYSQGIIHGGVKYALNGIVNDASEAIAAMPQRWRQALDGQGEIDLSGVKLLAPQQLLWSSAAITSRLAGFFASQLMRSRMERLPQADYPAIFAHADFKGQLYRLHEPVLDTHSLLSELVKPYRTSIVTGAELQLQRSAHREGGWHCSHAQTQTQWSSRALVLTAGEGSGALLQQLQQRQPEMKLRPLQMVMVRGEALSPLYAHALGASAAPKLTLTTHYDSQGRTLWYLGGELSEQGVTRQSAAQLQVAKQQLSELMPWLEQRQLQWATLPINRAEGIHRDGSRPTEPFIACCDEERLMTAWPTKLAFAPLLAERVEGILQRWRLAPGCADNDAPIFDSKVDISPLPWQRESLWSNGNINIEGQ
ncbi:FAD-dependent oxidoreductase [Ectothiorhodospiraceae bacterium BW-2]|nr:FAD-dependent oxidoreductase [Ectothiorhodospiraceae bacterium BW-2]